jgi:uncharacterized protein YxjI
MNSPYLIARKWTRTDRSAITDPAGQTQFEVLGRLRRKNVLTLADPAGLQVATVTRAGWAVRYQITAGNAQATVSLRGIFRPGYVIDTTTGQLRTRGRISGRGYEVSRGTATVARCGTSGACGAALPSISATATMPCWYLRRCWYLSGSGRNVASRGRPARCSEPRST